MSEMSIEQLLVGYYRPHLTWITAPARRTNTCGQAKKGDLKYPSMQRKIASQVMHDRLLEHVIGKSLAD